MLLHYSLYKIVHNNVVARVYACTSNTYMNTNCNLGYPADKPFVFLDWTFREHSHTVNKSGTVLQIFAQYFLHYWAALVFQLLHFVPHPILTFDLHIDDLVTHIFNWTTVGFVSESPLKFVILGRPIYL